MPLRRRRIAGEGLDERVRHVQARIDKLREQVEASAVRRHVKEVVRRIGLTRTGQVALLAAVIPWVIARLVAGQALYLFAYGTVALVAMSAALAPRRLKLHAERTGLFPRAQEGDKLEVHLTVTAQRSLTSFQIEERVPERLGLPVRVPVARIRSGEQVVHTYGLQCARRGSYTIGPLVAIASDPVGVSQRETVLQDAYELLVHPKVVRVVVKPLTRLYEDPPIRPPVSKPWPSGMEFYGMREFRPGDDLRRIVWRASARTGTIMVREAEQGITDHVTIVLDTDRGSHSRDGDHSESFETCVRVAASLGVNYLQGGYEIRLETGAGSLIRPMRGQDKTIRLLDALSRLEIDREPLQRPIRRLVADPRRDAQIMIVTPALDATAAAQLKLLTNRGVSITLVAVLWDEEDTETMGRAAALGCQVVPVYPGDDLNSALNREVVTGVKL